MQLSIESHGTDGDPPRKLLLSVARTIGAVALLCYTPKAEPQKLQSRLVEHVVKGDVPEAMRDVEALLADYQRALESKTSGAWEALYFGRGKGGALDQPWEDLVTATRGFILERSSETAAAKMGYINGAPSNAYADGRLAFLYLNEGENAVAKSTAETLLRASPNDVNALFVLAKLAERRGDAAVALRLCRQVLIELGPKRKFLNTFIPVYFAEGPRMTASCGTGAKAH